jgi:hypothetical protein
VVIEADERAHPRITKAVYKEKDRDKRNRPKWKLVPRSDGTKLYLSLKAKPSIYEV